MCASQLIQHISNKLAYRYRDIDTETDIDIHSHSLPWYVTEGGFTELRMGGAREGGPEELVGTGALGVKLLLQED
jgi:hypothetical protein